MNEPDQIPYSQTIPCSSIRGGNYEFRRQMRRLAIGLALAIAAIIGGCIYWW